MPPSLANLLQAQGPGGRSGGCSQDYCIRLLHQPDREQRVTAFGSMDALRPPVPYRLVRVEWTHVAKLWRRQRVTNFQ